MTIDVDKLKPVGERVLLKIQHSPVKSKGGLYIPEPEKKRSPLGKVVRSGEKASEFVEGDLVYFDLYEGMRIDEFHIILKKEFLYAAFYKEDDDEV